MDTEVINAEKKEPNPLQRKPEAEVTPEELEQRKKYVEDWIAAHTVKEDANGNS